MQSAGRFLGIWSDGRNDVKCFMRLWGPVCAYAAFIFYMSSQSHPEEQVPFVSHFSDKVLHAVEYGGLGALSYRALRGSRSIWWRAQAIPAAVLLASLYGISDEVHQAFVPFRDSNWLDWLADTIGAAIGVIGISRSYRENCQVPARERSRESAERRRGVIGRP